MAYWNRLICERTVNLFEISTLRARVLLQKMNKCAIIQKPCAKVQGRSIVVKPSSRISLRSSWSMIGMTAVDSTDMVMKNIMVKTQTSHSIIS